MGHEGYTLHPPVPLLCFRVVYPFGTCFLQLIWHSAPRNGRDSDPPDARTISPVDNNKGKKKKNRKRKFSRTVQILSVRKHYTTRCVVFFVGIFFLQRKNMSLPHFRKIIWWLPSKMLQVLMEVLAEKLPGFSFPSSGPGAEEEKCRKLRRLWGQAWQRTATQVGLVGTRWSASCLAAWWMGGWVTRFADWFAG